MRFESFASIGFALSLGAIIVMYLLKRKYVDTVVPSHMLWNRVLRNMEANKPWQKLRNQMLFWIQMLIAALLVFALMEPLIPSERGVKAHLVIVADTSASMAAMDMQNEQGQSVSRIEQMKSKLQQFVAGPASKSEITLIRVGEQPELIESRQTNESALFQSIDKLAVNYGVSSYRETMSLAASLTRMDKDAEIIVYTDMQWPEQLTGLTYDVPVRVEQISGQGHNVAIAQFGVKKTGTSESDQAQGVAVIRNWSNESQTLDVVLSIGDGDQIGDVQTITLLPGAQKTLKFEGLPIASHYALRLDIDDALQEDNIAYSFLTEQGQQRVLLLTEGNLFLEKALQLSGTEVVKIQLPPMDENTDLSSVKQIVPDTPIDMVILDRVADQSIDSPEWVDLFKQKPVWRIGSRDQSATVTPTTDVFEIKEHPINRYISMNDTHISQLGAVKSVPWGQPIIELGDNPVVFAGTEQGQPRLLLNYDLHQSDLPLRAEFPIFVRNSIEWLGESQMISLGRLIAGTTKEVAISPRATTAEWKLLNKFKSDSGSEAAVPQGSLELSSKSTYQMVPAVPGLYQFVQKDLSGNVISTANAEITMDSKESNIALQSELTFPLASSLNVQVQTDDLDPTESILSQQTDVQLMKLLAMLVILLILFEWGVYQRGNSI